MDITYNVQFVCLKLLQTVQTGHSNTKKVLGSEVSFFSVTAHFLELLYLLNKPPAWTLKVNNNVFIDKM